MEYDGRQKVDNLSFRNMINVLVELNTNKPMSALIKNKVQFLTLFIGVVISSYTMGRINRQSLTLKCFVLRGISRRRHTG